MKEILSTHASRYPEWVLADLYKLIYQAAMGPEHALTDETQARELLFDEIARLIAAANKYSHDMFFVIYCFHGKNRRTQT
jgi:hypothetical protein